MNTFYKTGRLPLSAVFVLIILSSALLIGCTRGSPSEKPPIHLNPNMDQQPKYKAQAESAFFEDGTMKTPVAGAIARGELKNDRAFYTGLLPNGSYIETSPLALKMENLKRGQEKYNIFCSPCHSKIGDGTGIVTSYNFPDPRSLHVDSLRTADDGYLFRIITDGYNKMPAYRYQINELDRWAIVNYVRALQRAGNASLTDIPERDRARIR